MIVKTFRIVSRYFIFDLQKADYIIKRKIVKNLEDTVFTLIIVIMVFMISNLYKRVKKLEDKIE